MYTYNVHYFPFRSTATKRGACGVRNGGGGACRPGSGEIVDMLAVAIEEAGIVGVAAVERRALRQGALLHNRGAQTASLA